MVLVWPDMVPRRPITTQVFPRGTLLVNFLDHGVGIEVDPVEHKLYPDLTHPATAGILLSMWLESSPRAFMSICRWGPAEKQSVEQVAPKRWAITMDLGLFDQDAEGSYLGTAAAKMLYLTWKRQAMTPKEE